MNDWWKYRAKINLTYFGELEHIFCRNHFKFETTKQQYNQPLKLVIENKAGADMTDIRLSGSNKFMDYDYRISLSRSQM